MKDWSDYIDNDYLIRNGDTGDSLRETCTALCGGAMLSVNVDNCYTPAGWVRHPNPTDAWHADPKEFSRDQWSALICYLVKSQNKDLLSKTWKLQKLFRAQNNDIVTYEYVFYMRAYRLWFLYPLMCILDLGLLINVILRVIKSYVDQNDTADDINVVTMLVTAAKVYPTPLVYISRLVYTLYKHGVYGAWQRYYARPEAPPMDELWKATIERYI